MKRFVSVIIFLFLIVQISAEITFSDLKGKWIFTDSDVNLELIFQSENKLIFDGEAANYSLAPGIIRVQDEYYTIDYPFVLEGKAMTITFPEGYQLIFTKAENSGGNSSKNGNRNLKQKSAQNGQSQTSGEEYLLQGKLCNWSGSSGLSSSYSTTKWIYFDGQGNFQYGSGTSFSSNDGLYDGNEQGNGGTYKVSENHIYLDFNDGSTIEANVHFRQDDNSISEIELNGDVYGKTICD